MLATGSGSEREVREAKKEPVSRTLWVDAHCHLDEIEPYTLEDGVWPVACGHSHSANVKILAVARRLKIPFALGVSPQTAQSADLSGLDGWVEFIRNAKPNAIGEIGLDFHWGKTGEQKARQHRVFDRMLDLAQEMKLPVVIHCREAGDAMLDMLEGRGWRVDGRGAKPETGDGEPAAGRPRLECGGFGLGAMWHFFSGTLLQTKRALGMGMMLSIPPLPSKSRTQAIALTPIENLLVETDAPIGARTPAGVRQSIEYVARVKGMDAEEAGRQTAKNAARLFRFELKD